MNTEKDVFDAMISDYIEAIRLNLNYASVYGLRGQVYRQLGQKKSGDSEF